MNVKPADADQFRREKWAGLEWGTQMRRMSRNGGPFLAVLALMACSSETTEPDAEAKEPAENASSEQVQKLPEITAVELITNSGVLRGPQGPLENTYAKIHYDITFPGVQQLVDHGLARWDGQRWDAINEAVNLGWQGNMGPVQTGVMKVPVFAPAVAIEAITTEGSRATVSYRIDFTPTEPFYTPICVNKVMPLLDGDCTPQPIGKTARAIRSDDGEWRLE